MPLRSRRRLGSPGTKHPRDNMKTAKGNGQRVSAQYPGETDHDDLRTVVSVRARVVPKPIDARPMDAEDAIVVGRWDA